MAYFPALVGSNLRGANYKRVMDECRVELLDLFALECEANNGRFSIKSLQSVSERIGLPLKTTCEFLEYEGKIPRGTWDSKIGRLRLPKH